jgi:hypothetical protein
MLNADLTPGQKYAFREKRVPLAPLQQIKLLKHVRGRKWQAKWIQPNAGLIDYVSTEQILVPWREHAAFLKEESDQEVMRQHNLEHGFEASSPITLAVCSVIENAGEGIHLGKGDIYAIPERFERFNSRARLNVRGFQENAPCYTDRSGRLHLPFEQALSLARAFCESEPAGVLSEIEADERKWSFIANRPGQEHHIPLLNSMRASWALVRQWCGPSVAIATKEKRIAELERLVLDAVYALQQAGLDCEADRLRRALA